MLKQLLTTTAVIALLSSPVYAGQNQGSATDEEIQTQSGTGVTGQDSGAASSAENAQGSDAGSDQTHGTSGSYAKDQQSTSNEQETTSRDEQTTGSSSVRAPEEREAGGFVIAQDSGDILASELMGKDVVNHDDETIGSVDDLLIGENEEVVGVVVGVGGFLGIGAKPVVISMNEIEFTSEDDIVVSFTREQLEEAPAFKTLEEQVTEQQVEEIERKQQALQEEAEDEAEAAKKQAE